MIGCLAAESSRDRANALYGDPGLAADLTQVISFGIKAKRFILSQVRQRHHHAMNQCGVTAWLGMNGESGDMRHFILEGVDDDQAGLIGHIALDEEASDHVTFHQVSTHSHDAVGGFQVVQGAAHGSIRARLVGQVLFQAGYHTGAKALLEDLLEGEECFCREAG